MSGELPEITEAVRLRLEPGDALVIRCPGRVTRADAEQIKYRVPQMLGMPGLRVVVLDQAWDVAVLAAGQEPPAQWGRPVG